MYRFLIDHYHTDEGYEDVALDRGFAKVAVAILKIFYSNRFSKEPNNNGL